MNPLSPMVSVLDYPLFVVTASDADGPSGCLVGFASQCSIEPPRWLVCLSEKNHTFRTARRAQALAVHLVAADQHDLASLFGEETGDMVNKFTGVTWHPGRTGAPVIEDCAAWFEGDVLESRSLGDHGGFLLAPVDGGKGPRSGQLTFANGRRLHPGHQP